MAAQIEIENWGPVLILGRHLYEWAAHVCYVREKAKLHRERSEWQAIWDVKANVMTGNLWIQTYGNNLAAQEGFPALRGLQPRLG